MKNKKTWYGALILISSIMATGDGENFAVWLIYEICCLSVLAFSIYKLNKLERN